MTYLYVIVKSCQTRVATTHVPYIGSTTQQPILITLQFNKWMMYIYVTGKSGKIADDVYIRENVLTTNKLYEIDS